jgi:hypothetical protein
MTGHTASCEIGPRRGGLARHEPVFAVFPFSNQWQVVQVRIRPGFGIIILTFSGKRVLGIVLTMFGGQCKFFLRATGRAIKRGGRNCPASPSVQLKG